MKKIPTARLTATCANRSAHRLARGLGIPLVYLILCTFLGPVVSDAAAASDDAGQAPSETIRSLPPLEGHPASTVEQVLQIDEDPGHWYASIGHLRALFQSDVWDWTAELGLNGSEGSARTLSILTSTNIKRKTEATTFDLGINYGRTRSSGIETQHYAILNNRFDWNMSNDWFLYKKSTLAYDEFKEFDLRLNSALGLGHTVKTEAVSLKGRFGLGASREFGGVDDRWIAETNFGMDYEHQLSKKQKLKLSFDYFPSLDSYQDYRLITDFGWQIILDEATNLSLKIGAVDRYDSTPNGAEPNDIDYFVTLLWKL